MTDKQFDKIIKMIRMVLDGCTDLEEAKRKVDELLEDGKRRLNEGRGSSPALLRLILFLGYSRHS